VHQSTNFVYLFNHFFHSADSLYSLIILWSIVFIYPFLIYSLILLVHWFIDTYMFQTTADKNCYAMTGSGENFYGFICHQHTPWYVNVLQIFTPIAVKTDTCHSYVSVLKTFTPTALNTRPHTMHQCTLDIHTHCCQNWLTIQQSAPDIHTFCCPHTHTIQSQYANVHQIPTTVKTETHYVSIYSQHTHTMIC